MTTTEHRLVLNTASVVIPDVRVRVGRQPFDSGEQLCSLREQHRTTHIFKRRGNDIIDVPIVSGAAPLGQSEELRLGTDFGICKALILDAYLRYLAGLGRGIIGYEPLDFLAGENILPTVFPEDTQCPEWLAVRLRYKIDIRRHYRGPGRIQTVLALGQQTSVLIDGTCAELMELGVDLIGRYVRKTSDQADPRLRPFRRLFGKVVKIGDGVLLLDDTCTDEASLKTELAYLEPRRENLRTCLQAILGDRSEATWRNLSVRIAQANDGEAKLKKTREVLSFLSKQNLELVPGVSFSVGQQQEEATEGSMFPEVGEETAPVYVFGPSQKTDTWHNRGLEKFGPYDQSTFTPSSPKIAVVCQSRFRGQTELFLRKLLDGVQGIVTKTGREPFGKGLVRLYGLDRCDLEFYEARGESPNEYKAAIGVAIESAADRNFQWNLALIQIQEHFHALWGDENPYLVSKAALLSRGVPSQEVEIETMQLPDNQLVYVLNNLALACYAKLGGIPWLIQANRGIAHELVFGLGSASVGEGRLGLRERVIGITTVFTGDGNYVLENRSRAVTVAEYPQALLESLTATIERVRQALNWQQRDSVRLVFHSFKPFKNEQVEAVSAVVSTLKDYDVQYAFLHVIEDNPYVLFDEATAEGVRDGQSGRKKGRYAPQRGLHLRLGDYESLLVLTGAKDVKRPEDGLPSPILLRLDRSSTFQDMTYLTRQAYHFASHSWRSFFPSPMPITILYSELIASLLGNLCRVSKWESDAMRGPIGRTRWFL